MTVDFKKFFKNHLIFLLVFNFLFMLLMFVFFNNIKKGITYSLFIDVDVLGYENIDSFDIDVKNWIQNQNFGYEQFHKAVSLSEEFNENIAVKIFRINPKKFKVIFYTYDAAFDKKNILVMTDKLISKTQVFNNKNFKPKIENKINDFKTALAKKRERLSFTKPTYYSLNKLGIDAIDIYDDVIKKNKIDLSKLVNTDFDLIANEKSNFNLIVEFIDQFDTLINLQRLYDYYNENKENSVNRYIIQGFEKGYIYFKNFEYFYIFFGILISIMSSFLILIFIDFRKKN